MYVCMYILIELTLERATFPAKSQNLYLAVPYGTVRYAQLAKNGNSLTLAHPLCLSGWLGVWVAG